MASYRYFYGFERWATKRARHLTYATSVADQRRAALKAEYEAGLAEIDRDAEEHLQQVQIIDLCTPGGRWDSQIANVVVEQYGLEQKAEPVKRGRGRPRKYGPDNPKPPRPSRAKTAAGRLRAQARLQGIPSQRRKQQADKREVSGTVSTVTASPSRTPLPKFAPDLGRKLLESTLAGSAMIDMIGQPVDVSVTEPPANETPYEILIEADASVDAVSGTLGAAGPRPKPEDEFYASPVDLPADLGDGDVVPTSGLVLGGGVEPFEPGLLDEVEKGTMTIFVRDHHELVFYRRGEDGIACHDYDFSDPMDRSKAKPWLLEMFPMFGLRLSDNLQPAPYQFRKFTDLTDEEAQAWIDASIHLKLSDRLMNYFERSPLSAKRLVNEYNFVFAKDMWLEQRRRLVWPFIQQRLIDVELLAHRVKQGEMTLEQAKVLFTYQEMAALRAMPGPVQDLYYQIVDAMEWFEGFSPRELLHWRGIPEPRFLFRHRDKDGFARWMYPAHLYDAVRDLTIVDRGFVAAIPMLSNDIVTSASEVMLWEIIQQSDSSEEEKASSRRRFGLPDENPVRDDAPRILIS